jgi:7-cyano-7-deazaguanine synthase
MENNNSNNKAIVLFSGGLDSTTLLVYVLKQGFDVIPLTFNYGQRHIVEIKKGLATLDKYQLQESLIKLDIDLSGFSGCSLTNKNLAVPSYCGDGNIPSTYVPSRNLIFLSIASGIAETIQAEKIFIGVNSLDYSGYPDCRPEFIKCFNSTLKTGTKQGSEKELSVEAPFINMSKKDIIELGLSLSVDYSLTHSCYNPDQNGVSCGICDSCKLRLSGFKHAKSKDPLDYLHYM